jgi:hypothetical protein
VLQATSDPEVSGAVVAGSGVMSVGRSQFAFVEDGAGTDEGDQVRGVDSPPAGLCGVDQLVGHGNSRGTGSGSLGGLGPQADGREGRLDRYLER